MAKELKFSEDARQSMLAGVDKLANAVQVHTIFRPPNESCHNGPAPTRRDQ